MIQSAFWKFYCFTSYLGTWATSIAAVMSVGRCSDQGKFSSTRLSGSSTYKGQVQIDSCIPAFRVHSGCTLQLMEQK